MKIKYRYWDSYLKQFVYSTDFGFEILYIQLSSFFTKAAAYAETVEQWTGLVDKNKKDIYDGDLIKINVNGYGPYRVFWKNGAWCSCGFSDCEPLFMYREIEVVSNIHETPEYEGVQ